jgi:hypothetical protein
MSNKMGGKLRLLDCLFSAGVWLEPCWLAGGSMQRQPEEQRERVKEATSSRETEARSVRKVATTG